LRDFANLWSYKLIMT